jgi:hypothetical protein
MHLPFSVLKAEPGLSADYAGERGFQLSKVMAAAALVAASIVSGCVRDAEIALPSDLRASAERIELTGMGPFPSGSFRLGLSQGRFTRSAGTERRLDTFVSNFGGGSFVAHGADFGGQVAGRCGFDEKEVDIGIAVLPTERLYYGCSFSRQPGGTSGGLMLTEVPTSGSILAGRTRAGQVAYGPLRLEVRAIHDMEGGRLPSGTPLGYAFFDRGRQIGAVDLNGLDKTIFAPRSGLEREAVLAASLALSVFWDPGD